MLNRKSLQEIVVLLYPFLLMFVPLFGISFSLIIGRPDYIIRALFIMVPCLIVGLLLFLKKQKYTLSLPIINIPGKLLHILFFILMTISILSCHMTEHRDYGYLIILLLMICVLVLEIFQKNIRPSLILAEIFLFGLSIAYSVTLNYPLYFGGADLLDLADLSLVTASTGIVPTAEYCLAYATFPLSFIYNSVIYFLSSLSYYNIYHIIGPLLFILFTSVIYLLARELFNNTRIALLISLFYLILPDSIYYSIYLAPRVLVYFAFLLLIYLILLRYKLKKDNRNYTHIILALEIIIFVYIILVHQVSIYQILFVCLIAIIITYIWYHKWYCIPELILCCIVTAAYWIYTSLSFLSVVIVTRLDFFEDRVASYVSPSVGVKETTYSYLIANIHLGLILFFVLVGIIYMISQTDNKKNSYIKSIVVVGILGLIFTIIYFPSPLTLSYAFSNLFRMDRLQLILTPLYAILTVIGIVFFQNYIKDSNAKKIISISIFILCFVIVGVATIGSYADFSIGDNQNERRYFIDDELASFSYINSYIQYGEELSSDHFVQKYFSGKMEIAFSQLSLPYYVARNTNTIAGGTDPKYTIIRMQEFMRSQLILMGSERTEYYSSENIDYVFNLQRYTQNNKLIYNNGNVNIIDKM